MIFLKTKNNSWTLTKWTKFFQSTKSPHFPLREKVGQSRKRTRVLCWSIYIISDLSCMLRLPGRWAGTSTVFYPAGGSTAYSPEISCMQPRIFYPAGGSTAYSPVISCNSAYFTLSVEVLLSAYSPVISCNSACALEL